MLFLGERGGERERVVTQSRVREDAPLSREDRDDVTQETTLGAGL